MMMKTNRRMTITTVNKSKMMVVNKRMMTNETKIMTMLIMGMVVMIVVIITRMNKNKNNENRP